MGPSEHEKFRAATGVFDGCDEHPSVAPRSLSSSMGSAVSFFVASRDGRSVRYSYLDDWSLAMQVTFGKRGLCVFTSVLTIALASHVSFAERANDSRRSENDVVDTVE